MGVRRSMVSASVVVRIAASLFSTTVVTAGLGFVFWALAAHITTTEVVGRASAVISAMQLIATFGTLGFNTLLIAELPRRDDAAVKRLVVTSLAIAGGLTFTVAAVYAIVVHSAARSCEWIYASPVGTVLFGAGAAATTVTIVLDGALVGVAQSGRQVARNMVFSVVKLVSLPVAALAVGLSPHLVFTVWLFGNIVSLLVLGLRTKAPQQWLTTKPSLQGFYPIWRTAAGYHWINVATQAPRLAMPVMVAAQLGAVANAGFYAVLLLVSVIWIIPSHFATAMLTLDRSDPEHFGRGLDTALKVSGALSLLAALAAPLLARPVLGLFGHGYEHARFCFIALATCAFASAVKSIYIPVRIAQGALSRAARATILGTVLEIGAVEVGLKLGAVTGVGIALGAAMVAEAVFFWPTIRRARRWSAAQTFGVNRRHGEGNESADSQIAGDLVGH